MIKYLQVHSSNYIPVCPLYSISSYSVSSWLLVISNQFQHLANHNPLWSAKFTVHLQWDAIHYIQNVLSSKMTDQFLHLFSSAVIIGLTMFNFVGFKFCGSSYPLIGLSQIINPQNILLPIYGVWLLCLSE